MAENAFKADWPSFALGFNTGKSKGGSGGGAELNIHYGMEPPEDTSKLWVSTDTPKNTQLVPSYEYETFSVPKVKLPSTIWAMGYATVGTKVYMFGGLTSSNTTYRNQIVVFDMETEEIATSNTVLPISSKFISASAVGNKIYLFGGQSDTQTLPTIYVFDVETEEIYRSTANLPIAAYDISSAAIGTDIYLFGGAPHNTVGRKVLLFDTITETISTLITKLPSSTSEGSSVIEGYDASSSAVIGNKAYFFGGHYSTKINVLDAETQVVSTIETKLPGVRNHMSASVVGTKVYLFGGTYGTNNYRADQIWIFDADTETIRSAGTTLSNLRAYFACASLGYNVYLLGGYYSPKTNTNSVNYSSQIEKFTTTQHLDENNLILSASLTDNVFDLFPSVSIGVKSVYKGNKSNEAEPVNAYIHNGDEWLPV